MSARERLPYDARAIQAPGLMRDGPYPVAHVPARPHRPLDPLPPPELLESKIASQSAEIERLLMENRRLAAKNVDMRQELETTQQEIERIKTHIRSNETESDIQIRGLLEKIRKMEDDIRAGDMLNKELKQAHMEAQNLLAKREELTGEIRLMTGELKRASIDGKSLPELHTELDGLLQEHKKLRVVFESEKGSNMEQVEQMQDMESNMISIAREIEKLRTEIRTIEKGEHSGNNPYGTYRSPDPLYPSTGHGSHGRRQPQTSSSETPQINGPVYLDGYLKQSVNRAGYSDSPYNVTRGG